MTDFDTIQLANERMTIMDACNQIGIVGAAYGYNGKLYCPFGNLFHADGGVSKAFRIYPKDNTAFCFAGCGYFNPVKLIAKDKDLSELAAAEYILDFTGYVPPDIDSQWAGVTSTEENIDTSYLPEALKMFCTRIDPDWETSQFTPDIAHTLRKCLELTAQVHTSAEVTQWLRVTKQVMTKAIGEHHVSTV